MPKGQRITNKASARASQRQTVNIHFDRAPAKRKRRAGGTKRVAAPPVINVHTVVSAPGAQPGMLPPPEQYQQAPPPKPVQPEAKAERIAEPLMAKPKMNWADNLIDALSPGRHASVIEPVAAAANRPRVETPAALPVAPEPMAAPPRPPPAAPMTPKPVPNIVEQIAPPPWRVETAEGRGKALTPTPTPPKPLTLKDRATSLLKRITDELSKPLPGTETQMHGNPLFDAPPTTAKTRTRAPPVPVQEQMPVLNAPSDSDDVRWKGRAAGRGEAMEPRRLGFTSPLKRETPAVVEEAVPKDRVDTSSAEREGWRALSEQERTDKKLSDVKRSLFARETGTKTKPLAAPPVDWLFDSDDPGPSNRPARPPAPAPSPNKTSLAAPSWFDGLGDLMQPVSVKPVKKKADPRAIVSEADLNPIPAINLRGPKTCPVCGEQFATERLKNIHYGKVHAAKK